MDIICLQETWLASDTITPTVEGYQLLEQRRQKGTRGGIATYIKNNLNIEQTTGNEYALHTKITLPNSQRINVVNIYLYQHHPLKNARYRRQKLQTKSKR
jgi:exonuclease III